MSKSKDSISNTIIVAGLLCIVCSVIVSTAAVKLKPAQIENKQKDIKENILRAAQMEEPGVPTAEIFKKIETKVVDLRTGKFTTDVSPETYNQEDAQKDPKLSKKLSSDEDIAGINRLEHYVEVYLVREQGELKKVILPIRGYGLWSTLKGFIALEDDLNTVVGLGYYDHKETPGLGGEVDNPRWKAQWDGKKIYDGGDVELDVIKGKVEKSAPDYAYKIDGLSGATLTSDGVENMIKFWMGNNAYGPFLENLKRGEA